MRKSGICRQAAGFLRSSLSRLYFTPALYVPRRATEERRPKKQQAIGRQSERPLPLLVCVLFPVMPAITSRETLGKLHFAKRVDVTKEHAVDSGARDGIRDRRLLLSR